jgi:hypothetical protein
VQVEGTDFMGLRPVIGFLVRVVILEVSSKVQFLFQAVLLVVIILLVDVKMEVMRPFK